MVEFKMDKRDNRPKLMEVNARFWGSLQLAISSGIDFPYLLCCLATGQEIDPPENYTAGVRSRWELGDLDHLLIRMKSNSSDIFLPRQSPAKWRVPVNFLVDFFKPSVRNEVLRFDDAGPFFFEFKQYIKHLIN